MVQQKDYLHWNVIVVPMTTGLFLIFFLIIQFTGESFGFSPKIRFFSLRWLNMYESLLMFVLIIAISQIIALNATFYLIKKMEEN